MSRARTNFHQIALMVLANGQGVPAVEALEPKPGKATLLRACLKLQEMGREVEAQQLYALVENRFPKGPGRRPPRHGEQRAYKVQKREGEKPFVRIPADYLGLEEGERALAHFGDRRVTVYPEGKSDAK